MTTTLTPGDEYVLNCCAKYLARTFGEARHDYGQFPAGDTRSFIAEAWRFPMVDSYSDGSHFVDDYQYNAVTFVYPILPGHAMPSEVGVIGTFATLFEAIPLSRVGATPYFAVTAVVPKGQVHTYQFMVDGNPQLDPVNPQRTVLDNGRVWSRFFTNLCSQPISFEDWELDLLGRITDAILPFRDPEAQDFLRRFYDKASRADSGTQYAHAFRLDQPVGVVNFIDKVVAREENHRLVDYKTCVAQMDRVLRQRNPFTEPRDMPDETYDELYQQMAADDVPGWDRNAYGSPAFFLKILRRHTFTGAFSHPKYGGNSAAAGWTYLQQRYVDAGGRTLFDWPRIIEQPLGASADYHG